MFRALDNGGARDSVKFLKNGKTEMIRLRKRRQRTLYARGSKVFEGEVIRGAWEAQGREMRRRGKTDSDTNILRVRACRISKNYKC